MALLEQWRTTAYSETANKGDLQRLWTKYFEQEKEIYAQLLEDPNTEVKGTVKELAEKYGVTVMIEPLNTYVNHKGYYLWSAVEGFEIIREETESRADGSVHWRILEAKLYEVSVCTFPAYEETNVTARAAQRDEIRHRALTAWKERQKARIKPSP